LPPLKLTVLVNRGAPDVPQALKEHGGPIAPLSPKYSRSITLGSASREVLRDVLDNDVVGAVEIERPNKLPFVHSPLPQNVDAALTHLVPQFTAVYPPGDGAGVIAAVFDEGAVRATHQEFQSPAGRVQVMTTKPNHFHATHVAGTMAATGVSPFEKSKGMAPQLQLRSFDWDNDLVNLQSEAVADVSVSNHSYGPAAGWDRDEQGIWFWWGDRAASTAEDSKFGKYSIENEQLDEVLHEHPHLLTVVAAGNDRSDGPITQPIQHYVIAADPATGELFWQSTSELHQRDGFQQGGVDTVAGLGLSKNSVCIGAILDATSQGAPIEVTNFSSWGPTDDGRIKPDVVANGFQLFSTDSADDSAYLEISGTSMASPTAAGVATLLYQLFQNVHGRKPLATEMKGLLIHTATDAGAAGPDAVYGWGSINTLAAGRVIKSERGLILPLQAINKGESKELRFASASEAIRVTVVWSDPPAPANVGTLDDATPTLQNNVDCMLVAPDGAKYFPYSLVRTNPLLPATANGPNNVDNVEVIDAPPATGAWTLQLNGTDFKVGTQQAVTVIVSGLKLAS
jgi:subtilisin family serine protease